MKECPSKVGVGKTIAESKTMVVSYELTVVGILAVDDEEGVYWEHPDNVYEPAFPPAVGYPETETFF